MTLLLPRPMTRLACIITLVLCIASICGCTVKIAYHFLDWGLQFKLNHYLSLNAQQSQQAEQAIKKFHRWHQRHELPTYVTFLQDAKTRLAGPTFTPEEIGAYREQLKRFGEQSLDQLLPSISTILQSLDTKQKQQLFKTLNEDQKEYEGLYLKPPMEKIRESLESDALKTIKKYMGRLNDKQKSRIKTWSQAIKPFGAAAASEQDRWEQLMGQLLNQPGQSDFSSQLKNLMMYDFSSWQIENRLIAEHNQAVTYHVMADLLNSRTPEQNTALIEKLDIYIEDCQDLIAQAAEEDKKSSPK